jgi:hypothetical protein
MSSVMKLKDICFQDTNMVTLIWAMVREGVTEGWDERRPTLCNRKDEDGNWICNNETVAAKPIVDLIEKQGLENRGACCPSCITAFEEKLRQDALDQWWKDWCPDEHRDTDLNHPEWNQQAWALLKDWKGGESLFLGGDTGSCKTRIMVQLLKIRALAGDSIDVLWPEDMKEAKGFIKNRRGLILRWGAPQYLGIDDALLAGADSESMTDFLKDLLDYRHRHNRYAIITSQINTDEWVASAEEKRDKALPTSHVKLLEATQRRIRQWFRPVGVEIQEGDF